MIQCPDCGKDIADDSAHCGFCGAKIETGGGKKTMIGFAAVTGEALREAAAEARQARLDAEAARGPSSDPATKPNPALPARPGRPAPADDGRPKLPQAPRPTPQAGLPAAGPPQFGNLAPGSSARSPESDAPTAALPAVGDAPTTVDEYAVGDGDFGADTDPGSPPTPFSPGSMQSSVPAAVETMPERPALSHDGPSEFGGVASSDGPTEFGGGAPMQVAQNTLPAKKKNPALLIVGILAVLPVMCCLFYTAYSFLIPFVLG